MKPAEFRCTREYLGLSAQWIAVRLNVNTGTVHHWETPRSGDVPRYAVEFIRSLAAAALQITNQLSNKYQTVLTDTTAMPVPVNDAVAKTGGGDFPASWYRMIGARVAERTGVALDYGTMEINTNKGDSPK